MKRYILPLIFVSLALTMASCAKEETPSLTVSPSSAEVSNEGETLTAVIRCNVDWTASSDQDWISISPTTGYALDASNYASIVVDASTEVSERTGTVTFKTVAGNLSATVTIIQSESPASLTVSLESMEMDADGGDYSFTVTSTRDWSVSVDVDWLSVSPESGSASTSSSTVTVTAEENTAADARTATVTIETSDGSITKTISVNQHTSATIITTAKELVEYLEATNSGNVNDAKLGANIDLSGVTLPEVPVFNAILNGNGYKLTNWTSSLPLVDTLASGASINGLTLDSSCNLSFTSDYSIMGFVVRQNEGTVSNVTSDATISIESITGGGYWGAIVGQNTGTVSGCINNSDISYFGESHTGATQYIGGVAGRTNASDAYVTNCTNSGDISFTTTTDISQSIYIGAVVGSLNNNSHITDCNNSGDVTISISGSSTNVHAAGIVAYSGGELTGCTNKGDISVYAESAEGAADGGVKGTGVAGIACYMGWIDGTLSNCNNYGTITLRAGYSAGYSTVGSQSKYASNVAGVAGAMYRCGLSNCNNYGTINSTFGNIDNSASNYNTSVRQSTGGVVSSTYGTIGNCTNSGDINVTYVTSTGNTLASNFVAQVGGISGGDYHSDTLSGNIDGCTNSGEITIDCDSSGSNNAFGGIVGWPGKEGTDGVNVISNCSNSGNVTLSGQSKSRMGGIAGGPGTLTGNANSGTVYLKEGLSSCCIGGVNGFGNYFNIIGCTNTGTVKSDVALTTADGGSSGGLGGLVGAIGNTAVTHSGCSINCEIVAESSTASSMLIGVIGNNKSGGTTAYIGTSTSPMKIMGTFNGTTLTEDNYETYMRRADYVSNNSNVTFNVEYGE